MLGQFVLGMADGGSSCNVSMTPKKIPTKVAGAGAGLLNQAIDVDLAELQDGDNLVELQADGTWTGSYRVAVTGVDLVLDGEVTP